MQVKFIDTIEILDNFLIDNNLINQLKKESDIVNTIQGQDNFNLTPSQQLFLLYTKKTVVNYCYKNLTFAEYPNNAVNILPKQNRLIIFPGFLTHRVKPYFGEKPRTSLVLGWKVKDQPRNNPNTI